MKTIIESINKEIFNWWINLPERTVKYTNPYLIIPTKMFMAAKRKIVILGKETNGWAQCEQEAEKILCGEDLIWPPERLEQFYNAKVNNKEIGSFPFWNFCWDMERAIKKVDNSVELCYANVALLGKPYGARGYDPNLAETLSYFLGKYLNALDADAIICLTGFGTKTRTELPYLKILEQEGLFGKYDRDKDTIIGDKDTKYPLRELYFEHARCPILGTVHPERKSREWKDQTIRNIILTINEL